MKQNKYLLCLVILMLFSKFGSTQVEFHRGSPTDPNDPSKFVYLNKAMKGSYITNDPASWELTELGGDINSILNENVINLEFDYSEINVEGFKYTEEEYISKMTEKYNKKSTGQGEVWLEKWIAARKNYYEPFFISSINETLEKSSLSVKQKVPDAKYTIVLSLKTINPDRNELTKENSSSASFLYKVYETNDRTKFVSYLSHNNVNGGHMGDTGERVSKCFSKTGKVFGKFLINQMNALKK